MYTRNVCIIPEPEGLLYYAYVHCTSKMPLFYIRMSNKASAYVYIRVRTIPASSTDFRCSPHRDTSVNKTKSSQRYCCSPFPPAETRRSLRTHHHVDAGTVNCNSKASASTCESAALLNRLRGFWRYCQAYPPRGRAANRVPGRNYPATRTW